MADEILHYRENFLSNIVTLQRVLESREVDNKYQDDDMTVDTGEEVEENGSIDLSADQEAEENGSIGLSANQEADENGSIGSYSDEEAEENGSIGLSADQEEEENGSFDLEVLTTSYLLFRFKILSLTILQLCYCISIKCITMWNCNYIHICVACELFVNMAQD